MKRVLMMASVASMIDLFNMNNIRILKEMGFEVDVACNFEKGSITSDERVKQFRKELNQSGINTYHLPVPRNIYSIKSIIKSYKIMKKICEENNYDIVHCHSPIGGVVARLACRVARIKGTKVIYTAHGFHFFKGSSIKNWITFYPIEKLCSRYTDILITINNEDYNLAKKFRHTNVEYIPGIGIDTHRFTAATIDRDKKRAEFGFDKNDFIFMSTGQISKRKNHEVIIKALSLIENNNIKYLIVGFGELEDYLKNLVKNLNIEDRVVFAGYRDDVKELLHIVDGFAFPSLQEGLPVALMEAMSVGLPVICSNIRGNVDLIDNNKGGFIYNCNDYVGFADGMKKIINLNSTAHMSDFNMSKIKKFDIKNIDKEMKRIYSLVDKREGMRV